MAEKPTTLPLWSTTGGTTVEPSGGQKAAGFAVSTKPPARWVNWLFNNLYTWIQYLNAPVGTGAGYGLSATGGSTSGGGLRGIGGAPNGNGVVGVGTGTGSGVNAAGGATGAGGTFFGGATSGHGVVGAATNGNSRGGDFTGQGSGAGANANGGATGVGLQGTGGATSGTGIVGNGQAAGATGVAGFGGPTTGTGVTGTGAGSGDGVAGLGGATGAGVRGTGGATSGVGVSGTGTNGNSEGVLGQGQGSAAGVKGTGGATSGAPGVKGVGGATNGVGVKAEGIGSGHALHAVGVDGYGVVAESDTTNPARAALHVLAQNADPTVPATGDVANRNNKLSCYDGSVWRNFTPVSYVRVTDAVSAASTGTQLVDSFTIPAASLRVGSIIEIYAEYWVTADAGGGTVVGNLRLGTAAGNNTLAQTKATNAQTDDQLTLMAKLTVRAIGASGAIIGGGISFHTDTAPGDATVYGDSNTIADVDVYDLTAGLDVQFRCTLTNASDQLTLKQAIVKVW